MTEDEKYDEEITRKAFALHEEKNREWIRSRVEHFLDRPLVEEEEPEGFNAQKAMAEFHASKLGFNTELLERIFAELVDLRVEVRGFKRVIGRLQPAEKK